MQVDKNLFEFPYIEKNQGQQCFGNHIITGTKLNKDHKVHRLLDFTKSPRSVKDPWYTGNFDEAYRDIYEGCQSFLEYLEKNNLH